MQAKKKTAAPRGAAAFRSRLKLFRQPVFHRRVGPRDEALAVQVVVLDHGRGLLGARLVRAVAQHPHRAVDHLPFAADMGRCDLVRMERDAILAGRAAARHVVAARPIGHRRMRALDVADPVEAIVLDDRQRLVRRRLVGAEAQHPFIAVDDLPFAADMGDLEVLPGLGQAVLGPHGRATHAHSAAASTHAASTHSSTHASTAAVLAAALEHAVRVVQIEVGDREARDEFGVDVAAAARDELAMHRAPVAIGGMALAPAMDVDPHRPRHLDMDLGQVVGAWIDVAPLPRKRIDTRRRGGRKRKNTGGSKGSRPQTPCNRIELHGNLPFGPAKGSSGDTARRACVHHNPPFFAGLRQRRPTAIPPPLMTALSKIRNFSIVAHIDHGKSTLADRLIQTTGGLTSREMKDQVLDSMEIERERGITIKAQTVRLAYKAKDGETYTLNLMDTPGHVDFAYEVSRCLAACEGALLVVDASQGVEAQTLANVYQAIDANLEIVPILNKVDLPAAEPERVRQQIEDVIGIDASEAVPISAKTGLNIEAVLEAIVNRLPAPKGKLDAPLKALLIDSYYDAYLGVVVLVRIFDGELRKGQKIRMLASDAVYQVERVGVFTPKQVI